MIIRYESDAGVKFVRKNNLDDVLDLDRFRLRSFKDYKSLLKTRTEVAGERLAKKLLRRMLQMMMTDLLENDIFVFPEQKFGYLRIGNLRNFKSDDEYPWDPRYDGAVYGGICVLNDLVRRTIGGDYYNFQLTQQNLARLRELRDHGKRYA